jgi:acyl-homoserine lactone synthase
MTHIHVVTKRNRSLYKSQLSQYYRLRHDVFVGERGWTNLRQADGIERDIYDNAATIYLLAIDDGRVVGGQRLYPTLLPHMMSDVFPSLASRGVPRGSTILEWTRYFVVRERRTGRTDCRLLAAMQEFCLEEGITQVTAVVEMWWLPRWQQVGFKVRPLGLPTTLENEACIGAAIDISTASLNHVRRIAGLRGPSLVRHGDFSPVMQQVPHVAA